MSSPACARFGRAAALIAALMVLALAADALFEGMRPSVFGEGLGMVANIFSDDAFAGAQDQDAGGSSSSAFMEAADAGEVDALARLPDGFAEEVLPLEGRADVRVGAEGAVVGFSTSEGPVRAFHEVAEAMRERGWTEVPSGMEAGGTFAKETGPRTWAWVACVRTGDTTSVVVQCATTGKG